MEKAIALFLLTTLVVVLTGMALVWAWSKQAAIAADAWINLLASNQFDTVLARSSPSMRQQVDAAQLEIFVDVSSLKGATPEGWGHREYFSRDQAVVLGGSCKTVDGVSVTVAVTLYRIDGDWLVGNVRVGSDIAQKLRRGADLGLGAPGLELAKP